MSDFIIENGVLTHYTGTEPDVVIPEGVTEIAPRAFRHCQDLRSVSFPQSLKIIQGSVFFLKEDLTELILPENLTEIGHLAFGACPNLTRIQAGTQITRMGRHILHRTGYHACRDNWKDGFLYLSNWLMESDARTVSGSITVPSGIVGISSGAFHNNRGLTCVTLPEGIRYLGGSAFANCTHLKQVTLPQSLETIGKDAFAHCKRLEALVIPSGVQAVENGLPLYYMKSLRVLENYSCVRLLGQEDIYLHFGERMPIYQIDEGFLPNEDFENLPFYFQQIAAGCYLSSRQRYSAAEQGIYDAYLQANADTLLNTFVYNRLTGSTARLLHTGLVSQTAIAACIERVEDPHFRAMLLEQLHRQKNSSHFDEEGELYGGI